MSQRGILIAIRSAVLGWLSLVVLLYFVVRPLLFWTAPIVGPSWIPTMRLAMQCASLAAVGWLIGRWGWLGVLVLAVNLAIPNVAPLSGIEMAWLIHQLTNSLQDLRYLESFLTALVTHALLFSALIIGARLSRPSERIELHIK